jgi:hypothetical protein
MLNPPLVAAYTVLPETYTPRTELLPKPVVMFVNVDPPSVDMLNPPPTLETGTVAAYIVLPEA